MKFQNFDLEKCFFISDLHLNHFWVNKAGEERGVILFERTQFKDIESHDQYIWNRLKLWAKSHEGATLFVLGDFGDITQLYHFEELRYCYNVKVFFLYGNHDKLSDWDSFDTYCDGVYRYPLYLNDRVILSHQPIWPCPEGCVNVHGHLHGAVLDSSQHITCSVNDIGYNPIGWKRVAKQLQQVPKVSYKFLEEPYVDAYVLRQERPDLVVKKDGHLDVAASRKKMGK